MRHGSRNVIVVSSWIFALISQVMLRAHHEKNIPKSGPDLPSGCSVTMSIPFLWDSQAFFVFFDSRNDHRLSFSEPFHLVG